MRPRTRGVLGSSLCVSTAVCTVHQHYREVGRPELVRGKLSGLFWPCTLRRVLRLGVRNGRRERVPPFRGGDAAGLRFMPRSAVFLQCGFRHPCPCVFCSFQPSAATLVLCVRTTLAACPPFLTPLWHLAVSPLWLRGLSVYAEYP